MEREAFHGWCENLHDWVKWFALGTGFGLAFFIAGFALLLVVPIYYTFLPFVTLTPFGP